jgi:hypothetical protein
LERFPLLPVDLATARAHAQAWAELAAAGRMIGPHDLWLAATCLAHGFTIGYRQPSRVCPGARTDSRGVERPSLAGPTAPNKALQPTASSVRSSVASAFGSG